MSFISFIYYALSAGKFFHLLRPDFWPVSTNVYLINSLTQINYTAVCCYFPTNKQTETFTMFSVAQNVFHWSDFLSNNLISYITGISLLSGQDFESRLSDKVWLHWTRSLLLRRIKEKFYENWWTLALETNFALHKHVGTQLFIFYFIYIFYTALDKIN